MPQPMRTHESKHAAHAFTRSIVAWWYARASLRGTDGMLSI